MKLITFGDSWTFGSELEFPNTQSWTVKLANKLNCGYINLGVPASSIPHMVFQFVKYIDQIEPGDICMFGLTSPSRFIGYDNTKQEFVNITSEATYYTDVKQNGRPPEVVTHMLNFGFDFYKYQDSLEFESFNTAMAISALQSLCSQKSVTDYYFSYFDNIELGVYKNLINPSKILFDWHPIKMQLTDDAFKGTLGHPNLTGHTEIAEILKSIL